MCDVRRRTVRGRRGLPFSMIKFKEALFFELP